MTYVTMRIVIQLLSIIPLPVSRFVGKTIGKIISILNTERGRISLDNMRKSYLNTNEESQIKKINCKVFKHFGQLFFEMPHLLRINKKNLHKYVYFNGEEHMRRAILHDKGVFVLTAHLGNWEILASAIPLKFGPSAVVARPLRFLPVNKLIVDLRSRFDMEIIPQKNGMRKVISALGQKKIIGVLLDQNVPRHMGVFTDFLGRKACANSALAHMALKFGTPVVPVFCTRQSNGLYMIDILEPVKLIRMGNKDHDIKANTAIFTSIIEKHVQEYPEQWFWFHRRWKTQPGGSIINDHKTGSLPEYESSPLQSTTINY